MRFTLDSTNTTDIGHDRALAPRALNCELARAPGSLRHFVTQLGCKSSRQYRGIDNDDTVRHRNSIGEPKYSSLELNTTCLNFFGLIGVFST